MSKYSLWNDTGANVGYAQITNARMVDAYMMLPQGPFSLTYARTSARGLIRMCKVYGYSWVKEN
jgi:hypothetical protein